MRKIFPEAFAALVLTIGTAILLAALAAGHADDAPVFGLIGFAIFFGCALSAFRSVREKSGG